MKDTTHSIMSSAKRFLGGTVLSRISGMLRDIAMAFAFGTHETIAAFLVAFRLSHLLRRLFGEGALQTAFTPQFEKLRLESSEKACFFYRDLLALLTVGLSALIFISMALLGTLLFFVDFSPGNREIISLTLLLMPSLLFICLFGLNASLLQCEKSYFTPGVAPVAFNLIWIVGVLCLRHLSPVGAMPWLAMWVIAACFFQWAITVPKALSILRSHGLHMPWKGIRLFSQDLKFFAKPLLLGIVGVAATQVNNALDAIFARYADGEGPAFLWYALRIQQLPLALFGIAIAGALLPPLTRALKNQELEKFHLFLRFAVQRSIALIFPITIALFVLGDSCINLIYGRGDFDTASIVGTTTCLWGYAAGLLPMTFVLIFAPVFYALDNARVPAIISVITVAINIFLNTLMISVYGLGAASVAFATSISAWLNFVFLAYALPGVDNLFNKAFLFNSAKIVLASMTAGFFVILFDVYFINGSTFLGISKGHISLYPTEFTSQFLRLSIQAICFCTTLVATAWMLKADDLLYFFTGSREEQKRVNSTQ